MKKRHRCKKCGLIIASDNEALCRFCEEKRRQEEEVALRWMKHASRVR